MYKNLFDEVLSDSEEINNDVSSIIFHSIIVSNLAYKVGNELGFDERKCYELACAGIVHDIGKIHLNNSLRIVKMIDSSNFNAEKIHYVRNHSIDSYNALKEWDYPEYILDAVLYHHENYDGTGYPDGLKGTDIPEGARVLRVCDVFAALVDRRVYRSALDINAAVETMIDEVKNYDMKIFLVFQRIIHEEDMEELFSWIVDHNNEEERIAEEKKQENRKKRKKRSRRK